MLLKEEPQCTLHPDDDGDTAYCENVTDRKQTTIEEQEDTEKEEEKSEPGDTNANFLVVIDR